MIFKKKSQLLIEVLVIFLNTLKKLLSEEVQIPLCNVFILLSLYAGFEFLNFLRSGVGLMAWSPLTMGLVSGKVDDGGVPLFARSSFKVHST